MIIYQDTERELTEYKPLPASLKGLSIDSLEELIDNLEKAIESFWLAGNDLYCIGIDMDIRKAKMYLTMARKRAAKQAAIDSQPGKQYNAGKQKERRETKMEGKMYRVKPEYIFDFGSDCDIFSTLSYDTLEMIARGWEKPMEEVLKMVYEDNEQNQKKYDTFERVPDFDSISEIMDYEIREAVHNDMSPCTEKAFLDEYKKRHKAYYGEEFIY